MADDIAAQIFQSDITIFNERSGRIHAMDGANPARFQLLIQLRNQIIKMMPEFHIVVIVPHVPV